jgi:DNA-binding transcriptional LysR family regulator
MDRLHSMQVFCKVIECHGFASAARALDLSPSVVTRLVADLESHLGVRLLNRTTRKLVLTEAGEGYLQQVQRVLADLGEAETMVRSSNAGLSGQLRVLAPPAFAASQLAPRLGAFRARYPNLAIELVAPGVIDTIDERFDVSLITRGEGAPDGQFVARRLVRSRVILCASPAYVKRRGRPRRPADLAQHELIGSATLREMSLHADEPGDPEVNTLASAFRMSQGPLQTTHMETALSAARSGLGIGSLPSYAAHADIAEGRLLRVLTGWHLFVVSLYVAYPTRKLMPARTRAFVDFLFEQFDDRDPDPWLPAHPAQVA